jgi:hypothetical protein
MHAHCNAKHLTLQQMDKDASVMVEHVTQIQQALLDMERDDFRDQRENRFACPACCLTVNYDRKIIHAHLDCHARKLLQDARYKR